MVYIIIEELAKTSNAIPLDKAKQRWIISWHTLEEWGDIIYSYVQDNGFIGSVCTFYELTQSEDTKEQGKYKYLIYQYTYVHKFIYLIYVITLIYYRIPWAR